MNPPNNTGTGGGEVPPAVAKLGGILGAFGVIFLTPRIFAATRDPVHAELVDQWGADTAAWLIWAVGFLEAMAVFWLIKLTIVACGTWLVMGVSRLFGR